MRWYNRVCILKARKIEPVTSLTPREPQPFTEHDRAVVIKIAEDLSYGPEVISKLRSAKTHAEAERIMVTARWASWSET